MIDELTFTPAGGGDPYDFFGPSKTVRVWRPRVAPRGQARARMGMHGRHPRRPVFDGLDIHQEGIVFDVDESTLMLERQSMLDAILGDLTAAPSGTSLGTLTVKYAGWAVSASGEVILEDWAAELNYEPGVSLPYMFAWSCAEPVFYTDETEPEPVVL